jgi:hypothetical protein
MNRVDEIEYMVACNELTAAQVFTQMRQLIPNKNIEAERDALQARIKQLEAELEEERQENNSLRGGSIDDYERGAE